MKRDDFIDKLKLRLDVWNAELTRIESTAQVTQAAAQEEFRKLIGELHERRDEAKMQLQQLQLAGEDAWEDLKGGAEDALAALGEAVDRARARFTH